MCYGRKLSAVPRNKIMYLGEDIKAAGPQVGAGLGAIGFSDQFPQRVQESPEAGGYYR